MYGSQPTVFKSKWLDHYNNIWVSGASEVIATREGILILFGRLLTNKEICQVPPSQCIPRGGILKKFLTIHDDYSRVSAIFPDFDPSKVSPDKLEPLISAMLEQQLESAYVAMADTPFFTVLKQRLLVLQRIYYAVNTKFHGREKVKLN